MTFAEENLINCKRLQLHILGLFSWSLDSGDTNLALILLYL